MLSALRSIKAIRISVFFVLGSKFRFSLSAPFTFARLDIFALRSPVSAIHVYIQHHTCVRTASYMCAYSIIHVCVQHHTRLRTASYSGAQFLTCGATLFLLAWLFFSSAIFFCWRDFFFADATLFLLTRLFFCWRDFFSLARLFFAGTTFFSLARLFL